MQASLPDPTAPNVGGVPQSHNFFHPHFSNHATVLAFDEPQPDMREPEFLKAYEGRGEHVQLDEGARTSIVVKRIVSESEGP